MSVSRLARPGAFAGTGQLVRLRSRTGAALITATVLASAVTAVDANVIKVAVPAIGRGLGMGTAALQWTLTSYLLTVAALAAVGDADLGEASGINDAASRIGGVVVIAVVPLLIGATGRRGYAGALAGGYQPAMIVMAGLCVAAAVITVLFVSDDRPGRPAGHRAGWMGHWAGHRLVPRAPENGCPPPVPVLTPQEES